MDRASASVSGLILGSAIGGVRTTRIGLRKLKWIVHDLRLLLAEVNGADRTHASVRWAMPEDR